MANLGGDAGCGFSAVLFGPRLGLGLASWEVSSQNLEP